MNNEVDSHDGAIYCYNGALSLISLLLADSTSTRGCPKAAARVISTRSRNPWLDFSLFRNFQRVIHLDAEVSDRTFQFGMAKQ
ncbi:hypothetical protein ICHIJ1_18880 [Fluviibacter phosphoraccumulans]|uniref:Uncharacterized protein n=1 Tax=Fluviibacter phosphoraccumulans TaxID=1751046 RepID=A0A679HRV9_9RHOO|nr:hypothetical protein ICHIAU1_11620 [Fluviibacter phosphoraccumulans]BBU71969.1 hypothetical protein ICHIJ1_18880 [Fluviibacter phosphoraccumulans]BCA64785.1 hypothetical protein SHINM1_003870 [Fluviibacter phosphoraccumulans]BCA64956.1 hypothetical protein SHINM1_005580 [Fluviibacter phosphoraccumulans]